MSAADAPSSQNFASKVAFVTGGASGIGLATAELLASRGAAVAVVDLRQKACTDVADDLKARFKVPTIGIACDVSRAAEVEAAVERCVQELGGLHLALNAAGQSSPGGSFAEYPLDDFRQMIDVHLVGAFYCIRYQIAAMLKGGGGSIVNVASVAGQVALGPAAAYIAAKHGVIGLTKTAAVEYSRHGIRINAVGPGFISTPLLDRMASITMKLSPEEAGEVLGKSAPIGRVAQPIEVARAVAFLLSPEASFMSGGFYPVDGGYLATGNLGALS